MHDALANGKAGETCGLTSRLLQGPSIFCTWRVAKSLHAIEEKSCRAWESPTTTRRLSRIMEASVAPQIGRNLQSRGDHRIRSAMSPCRRPRNEQAYCDAISGQVMKDCRLLGSASSSQWPGSGSLKSLQYARPVLFASRKDSA